MRRHQDHIKIRKNWLPPTVRGEVDELASPEPQAISLEEMLEDVTTLTILDRDPQSMRHFFPAKP